MKTLFLYFFIMMCFLASCSSDEDIVSGAVYNKNCVTTYWTPESLTMSMTKSELDNDSAVTIDVTPHEAISSGKAFDLLASKFGDVSYNRYTVCGPKVAMNDSILSVNIVTLDDFDESHPSGSDVSEYVDIQYASYYDFIQSGYKQEEISEDERQKLFTDFMELYSKEGLTIHDKKLTELTSTDTRLVAPKFVFRFNKRPVSIGKYRFKMTLSLSKVKMEQVFIYCFLYI